MTSTAKYGVPRGTNTSRKVSSESTLSNVQNAGPDSGDVHLFEQDMQALRAIFEIAVAVPQGENFAVIEAENGTAGATITINYSNYTVARLKSILDDRGVSYPSNALKADLVALAEGSE